MRKHIHAHIIMGFTYGRDRSELRRRINNTPPRPHEQTARASMCVMLVGVWANVVCKYFFSVFGCEPRFFQRFSVCKSRLKFRESSRVLVQRVWIYLTYMQRLWIFLPFAFS